MFAFPTGPRREIMCNFSKRVAKHACPPGPPPPQAAALTLSSCSLMGYRLFPCSCTWLHGAKTAFCPQCCLFPALVCTTVVGFFPKKCDFLKPDKSIIKENNVASHQGTNWLNPNVKYSVTNIAGMWARTLNNFIS